MPGIASERTTQQLQRLAFRHAAAGLVRQRDHAIDVRVVGQGIEAGEGVALERIRHQSRYMGAAVHRGQDPDVVARRYPPVRRRMPSKVAGISTYSVGLASWP